MFPLSRFDWVEIAAFLVGLLCLHSLKGSGLQILVALLGIVVLAELSGRYMAKVLHRPNAWVFNISTTLEFLVYALIFYRHFIDPVFKKMAWSFLWAYPVVACFNILFVQGIFTFHSLTMSLGSLFMILFCCLSFYEILLRPEKINLLRMPMFWISIGILLFYSGDLLYNLFFITLTTEHFNYKPLFREINNNLIILLYFCFIMAFLCKSNRSFWGS